MNEPLRTLYLDHWPPSIAEIADGFALFEARSERVASLAFRPEDLPKDNYNREDGGMWGAELVPAPEGVDRADLLGENGTRVSLAGPGAGEAIEPFHRTEVRPPSEPTDEDLDTLRRFDDHATTEDFAVTAREYATLRKFARDRIDVETSARVLRTGIVAYKVWTADGAEVRAAVRIPQNQSR